MTIGRGVGLGIVVGGDVYRGARGGAGEFGHVPIVENGPSCECGMRGCLEALVADPALVAQAVDAGLLSAGVSINDGTAAFAAWLTVATRPPNGSSRTPAPSSGARLRALSTS